MNKYIVDGCGVQENHHTDRHYPKTLFETINSIVSPVKLPVPVFSNEDCNRFFYLILWVRLRLSGLALYHQQTLLQLTQKDFKFWIPFAQFL